MSRTLWKIEFTLVQSIRQLSEAANADADAAVSGGIAVSCSFWPRLHFQLLVARRCLKREVAPAQGDC